MSDNYLVCIQDDINKLQSEINQLEINYKKELDELIQKLSDLKKDEDKIMKRTKNLDRCKRCDKFGCISHECTNLSLDHVNNMRSEYKRKLEDLKGDEDIIMLKNGLKRCPNCDKHIAHSHMIEGSQGDYYSCKGIYYNY